MVISKCEPYFKKKRTSFFFWVKKMFTLLVILFKESKKEQLTTTFSKVNLAIKHGSQLLKKNKHYEKRKVRKEVEIQLQSSISFIIYYIK